jgi:hypothetical protein
MAKRYIFILLILSIAYLIVELGFNSKVLDAVGTLSTASDFDALEKWSRVISGAALTLALWGSILGPAATANQWARIFLIPIGAVIACVSFYATWEGQRVLFETIVSQSDGATRKTAFDFRIVSLAMLNGTLPMRSVNIGGPQSRSPEVKAFLALFPAFAFTYPNIHETLQQLINSPQMRKALDGIDLNMPPAAMWDGVFRNVFTIVRNDYETKYLPGSEQFDAAILDIPNKQEQAWNRYVDEINKKEINTGPLLRLFKEQILSSLKENGLDLPSTWDPTDQHAFYNAIDTQIRTKASNQFARETADAVGSALPPNLSWTDFCAQPAVRNRILRELSLPTTIPLSCVMNEQDFLKYTLPALPKDFSAAFILNLKGSDIDFANGGKFEKLGRLAFGSVIAPPMALAFSVLGALTHIFKIAKYIFMFGEEDGEGGTLGALIIVGILVALVWKTENIVTQSEGFNRLESSTDGRFDGFPFIPFTSRWLIQAAPLYYPIASAIRSEALGGFEFDRFPETHIN